MNGWNYADESGPISLGPQGVVETEQSLQLSSQQNLNTVFAIATTPPESPTSSPAPARPVPPKRQYHSLVLKFVIELATNVPFIALDELQTKRGGRVAHGASMKASQGRWRGQEVAVKTVNDDLIPKWTDEFNEEKKRKFRKTIKDLIYEIRAISHTTLRGHRNIVTLLAIGIEDTYINSTENDGKENTILEAFSPILVLPWALSDLDSLWAKGTLERPEEAADIVSDIADGLMALHKHDIVHGDIKPGNILLFQDPKDAHRLVAKIADFGAISSKQNNRYNSNEGTIGWAAPECFQNPNQAPTEFDFDSGRARDVFSFGLVAMHVALEGRFGREWQSDVDRRREYLDYALTKHYTEKWPTHQQLLVRWRTLLRDTVVEKPRERMNPDHLTNIRKRLLDSDPFEETKQRFYDEVIPFTGRRGLKDDYRHSLRFCSRMGTERVCKAIRVLPQGIKDQLSKDYENFNAWRAIFTRDFRYKRAASRISFIAQALVDDRSCLPIEFDHRAMLLMSCNAPGSKGLGFLESWVGLFLNCGLYFAPTLREYIRGKAAPLFSQSWEYDEDEQRRQAWDAAQNGDLIKVKVLVNENRQLLHTSHLGSMLIHQATRFDQVEVVEYLLRKHPPLLHAKNHIDLTPLHVAAGGPAVACIQFLLEKGADVTRKGTHGNTPLDHALGVYLYFMFVPLRSTDKYREVIRILRERSPPNASFRSFQAMVKARVDLFTAHKSQDAYTVSVAFAYCSMFWFLLSSLSDDVIVQFRLTCLAIAIVIFMKLDFIRRLAPICATIIMPQSLWLCFLFHLSLWLEIRQNICGSRFEEEASFIWRATGHKDLFDANNPEHEKEVEKIIQDGLEAALKDMSGQNPLSSTFPATQLSAGR